MATRNRLLPFFILFLTGCSTFGAGAFSGPSEPSVLGSYLKGRFAAQSFDLPEAEAAFEEVARQTDRPEGNRTAFGYALALGDIEEAVRQAEMIVANGGEDEVGVADPLSGDLGIAGDLPRLTLASDAMRRGRAGQAAAILEEPLGSSLGQSLSVLLRSAALLDAEGPNAAAEVLAAQEPGTFRGLVPLQAALMLDLTGDRASADAAYRQALSLPRTEVAALAYGQFLERNGKEDEAAELYRRMLQDAGILTRGGRMGLTRLGELEGEPRSFVRFARDTEPVAPDARAIFALALENFAWLGFEQAVGMQADNPVTAQRQRAALIIPLGLANLARTVDADRDAADYLAALIFSFYGSPAEAIDAADDVPPESWAYSFTRLEAAGAEGDRGEIEDAIRVLEDAVRRDGRASPQWALQLQVLLAAEKRYEDADRWGTTAIEEAERLGVLPSSLWRYYFTRGAARLEAGRDQGAFSDLEKALELAPDEPVVLNHLGYSYVERGEQLERAFGMIERALDIDPQNGAIVDSLGWANFQRGNYRAAVEQLETAVALEPADAVITDHLGDAYFMVGREREARYEWQRVLTLDDADAPLKEAVSAKLDGDFSGAPILAGRDASR